MSAREDNDLFLGAPMAGRGDEERTRCGVCGGRHLDDGACERCGVTRDEADGLLAAGPGRYVVAVVQQDGVPRDLCSCATFAAACELVELLGPWAKRLHGIVGFTDEQDGERGWLQPDDWRPGDAGPDPV